MASAAAVVSASGVAEAVAATRKGMSAGTGSGATPLGSTAVPPSTLILAVSAVASVSAVLMTLSLGVDVRNIIRHQDTDRRNFLPFIATLSNAAITAYYGLFIHDWPIIVVNGVNAMISLVFCVIFYEYSSDKARLRRQLLVLLFVSLALGLLTARYMDLSEATNLLALLSNMGSLLLFASPLTALIAVWRNKADAAPISLPLALMSLCCSVSWFFYGMLIDNVNVALPNVFGVATSLAQLFVWWRLRPDGPVLPTTSWNYGKTKQ